MGALFPFIVLRRCYDDIVTAIREVGTDVQGFINLLLDEVRTLDEFIGSTDFRDDSITYHIAKKDDLESMYFHDLQPTPTFTTSSRSFTRSFQAAGLYIPRTTGRI